jgi:hypothetical protein
MSTRGPCEKSIQSFLLECLYHYPFSSPFEFQGSAPAGAVFGLF